MKETLRKIGLAGIVVGILGLGYSAGSLVADSKHKSEQERAALKDAFFRVQGVVSLLPLADGRTAYIGSPAPDRGTYTRTLEVEGNFSHYQATAGRLLDEIILANADYKRVGDLHQIKEAVLAEKYERFGIDRNNFVGTDQPYEEFRLGNEGLQLVNSADCGFLKLSITAGREQGGFLTIYPDGRVSHSVRQSYPGEGFQAAGNNGSIEDMAGFVTHVVSGVAEENDLHSPANLSQLVDALSGQAFADFAAIATALKANGKGKIMSCGEYWSRMEK